MTEPAIISAQHTLPVASLDSDPLQLRAQVEPGAEVAIRSDDAAVVAGALRALDGHAATVHLLPAGVAAPDRVATLDTSGPADVTNLSNRTVLRPAPRPASPTAWVIYTSGTTGAPKPVRHTIDSLSRTVVTTAAAAEHRWGLLYDPNRMAGLQVILQALATEAALVAPDPHATLAERIATLADHGVTAVSATPTLWRKILQIPRCATWTTLRQITLGGEIADQHVLTALAKAFPAARIVHVFASTETGAAFSVVDGRAGFPAAYLDTPPRGIALQVRDGILHVHAPGVSTAEADGFVATGDRVEIEGDRVLFRGRDTGVVNVGGANVWPEEVETLLRTHPEVAEASVTAKPNPMSGNVLIAAVVPTADAATADLAKRVRLWVRQHAPTSHVPAVVKVVDELSVSAAGKLQRR